MRWLPLETLRLPLETLRLPFAAILRSLAVLLLCLAVPPATRLLSLAVPTAAAFERARSEYGASVFWPGGEVPLPEAPPELGPGAQVAAERAFRVWSAVPCGTLRVARTVPGPRRVRLALVRGGWSHGASEAAYTTLDVDRNTGEIRGALVELNGAYSFEGGPGGLDLEQILTHEAGHALGLAHSFDRQAVMHGGHRPGAPHRPLQPDDIAGICAIYPRSSAGAPGASSGSAGAQAETPSPQVAPGLVGASAGAQAETPQRGGASGAGGAVWRPGVLAVPLAALVALAVLGARRRRRRARGAEVR